MGYGDSGHSAMVRRAAEIILESGWRRSADTNAGGVTAPQAIGLAADDFAGSEAAYGHDSDLLWEAWRGSMLLLDPAFASVANDQASALRDAPETSSFWLNVFDAWNDSFDGAFDVVACLEGHANDLDGMCG